MKYVNAQVAQVRSQKIIDKLEEDEIDNIFEQIEININRGNFFCELLNTQISNKSKEFLEDLQYVVEIIQDVVNEYKTVISWENLK
jgi:hypothetical protein